MIVEDSGIQALGSRAVVILMKSGIHSTPVGMLLVRVLRGLRQADERVEANKGADRRHQDAEKRKRKYGVRKYAAELGGKNASITTLRQKGQRRDGLNLIEK